MFIYCIVQSEIHLKAETTLREQLGQDVLQMHTLVDALTAVSQSFTSYHVILIFPNEIYLEYYNKILLFCG